ncbi:flagellar assembly protein FliH [Rhizomicrobium palustre]|jgi:flagellar assembly protein FliH|uniref:Flagellar assembly protein FliH n=1 Tax=Rhizomicrobium palustre TaxID=189966 RepID=A0A846MWT8_9PROT|nr:FliH/SctL family protein [Rhizomicrobium palustre]NIK87803.1 flagellar assembly protein FliH [Rhizomicrobium palustre]
MNTAEIKKYTFDTEFRPEGDLISNAARLRQKKVLTQEELDSMLSRAREQGMKMGQVRAAEATAAAVQQLCVIVRQSMDTAQGQLNAVREEASALALVAGRKLAHVAVGMLPQGEIEEALREAIHQAIAEPRIVLRAAPQVIEAVKDRLEELALELGYEGRLVATPDPSIPSGDCRIEWRGGGAERSMQHLEEAIGEVIARRISQDGMKG